jgi:hypothetical protein
MLGCPAKCLDESRMPVSERARRIAAINHRAAVFKDEARALTTHNPWRLTFASIESGFE